MQFEPTQVESEHPVVSYLRRGGRADCTRGSDWRSAARLAPAPASHRSARPLSGKPWQEGGDRGRQNLWVWVFSQYDEPSLALNNYDEKDKRLIRPPYPPDHILSKVDHMYTQKHTYKHKH